MKRSNKGFTPNFGMSSQLTHSPQSSVRHGPHLRHLRRLGILIAIVVSFKLEKPGLMSDISSTLRVF
jgi:hypothetical protein